MRKKERGIIALLLLKTAVAQNMTDGFELNPRVTNQYGMADEGTSIFFYPISYLHTLYQWRACEKTATV